MNESHSTTCPYCGEPLDGRPHRKQKGASDECRKAYNRERANKFTAAHPGYYAKYDTADCYEHTCEWCGLVSKTHRQEQRYCSPEHYRLAQAEQQAEKQRQKRMPILHPGPYSWLPVTHPAMLMQQPQVKRLFIAGVCARCGKPFLVHSETGIATYCSTACASLACKARRRACKRMARCEPYRRIDIFERDGWRCHICGKKIRCSLPHSHPLGATLDHLIPLANGGADAPDNVAAAHRLCNSIKGVSGAAQLLLGV